MLLFVFYSLAFSFCKWVLTKTRNDLKRTTTTYNKQETTYNGKKQPEATYNEQETTWNDPQRVRHNLQLPEHTYNKQIFRLFYNMRQTVQHGFHPTFACSHSSIASWKIMVKAEHQKSIIMRQAPIIMCIFYGI